MYNLLLVKDIILEIESFGDWLEYFSIITVLDLGALFLLLDIIWIISENYYSNKNKRNRRKRKNKNKLVYIDLNRE